MSFIEVDDLPKQCYKYLQRNIQELETQEGKCYYCIAKKTKSKFGFRKGQILLMMIKGKSIGYLYEIRKDCFQTHNNRLSKMPRPKKIVDFGGVADVIKQQNDQILIKFVKGAMDVDEWLLIFANTKIREGWRTLIKNTRQEYKQSQKKKKQTIQIPKQIKDKPIQNGNQNQNAKTIVEENAFRMDEELYPELNTITTAKDFQRKDVQDQAKLINNYQKQVESLEIMRQQFQKSQLLFQKQKDRQLNEIQRQKEELEKQKVMIRNRMNGNQKQLYQLKKQNQKLKKQNSDLKQKYQATLNELNQLKEKDKDSKIEFQKKIQQIQHQYENKIAEIRIELSQKRKQLGEIAKIPKQQNLISAQQLKKITFEMIKQDEVIAQQKKHIAQLQKQAFFHIFPSIPLMYRRFLENSLRSMTQKQILYTTLIFRYEKEDHVGFHRRIDGKINIMLTMQTKTGKWIAMFSEGGFCQDDDNLDGFSFIAALNQEKIFKKIQNKPNTQYDSEYLTVGVSELRIQQLQNTLYSNFDLPTGHYYSPPNTVDTLLGASGKREVQLQNYEIHQITWR